MKSSLLIKEPLVETYPQSLEEIRDKEKEHVNWSRLPCEGIYKLSGRDENLEYRHCNSAYWKCPNKKCIMHLI